MAETIKGLNIKLGLDSTELNEKLTALKNKWLEIASTTTEILLHRFYETCKSARW